MVGELTLLLATHLVLTALPGVAAALAAASRGERRVPVLLAVALAASGLSGLLGFWIYYGDHLAGQTFTFLLALGSALASAWLLHDGNIERRLLRALATPLALWALGSAFLVFFGFLHGGDATPLATAANRFSLALPSDNYLPLFFGEFFYAHGHHGVPPEFPGEWLASDRPPLQIGYFLSQRPFAVGSTEPSYQVLGVCLQQLWIVGLWALLVAARLGRRTMALVAITVLLSPLALVNGFFVWPKLLPAAMLLAAAALLITPLWVEARGRLWVGALVGALLGLAMMGHGASAFAIVPLVLVPACRGLPSRRWTAVGLAVLVVVMAPWSAYQRWGDPPGNRLVKWTLAGVAEVDSRGTLSTIRESYEEAGLGGMIHNKAENVVTVSGGGLFATGVKEIYEGVGAGDFAQAVHVLRAQFFFYLLPSLGLLLLGPPAMLAALGRRRRGDPADWRFARDCLLTFAVGVAAWCLLLFGNIAARPAIHQGSYLLPILGIAAGVAGLRAVAPRLGAWIVGLSAALMLALYVPSLDPPDGTSYSLAAILSAAACLAVFCWIALRPERGAPEHGRRQRAEGLEAPPAPPIDSPA